MTKKAKQYNVRIYLDTHILVEADNQQKALEKVARENYGMSIDEFKRKHHPTVSRRKKLTSNNPGG